MYIVLGRYLFLRGFPRESNFSLSNIRVVSACFWVCFLWMLSFNFWFKSSPIWTLLGFSRMVCPHITTLSSCLFCGWAQFSWFGLDLVLDFGLDFQFLIQFSVYLYDRFWTDRVRFFWGHRLAVYRFWSVSKSDIIKCVFLGCFWGFSEGVFCLFSTGLFWAIYCPKRCTESLFRQSAILYTSMLTEGCSRQPNLRSGVWRLSAGTLRNNRTPSWGVLLKGGLKLRLR